MKDGEQPGEHSPGRGAAGSATRLLWGHSAVQWGKKTGDAAEGSGCGQEVPSSQSSHPTPHRARQPLLSCVRANLSFFSHYPGMYCHLIFMYAILPDKYDLLPGNSSDIHSAPCSNYSSHPQRGGPVVHLSDGSRCGRTPLHASPILANAREREMRWLHLHSPAPDSWVSSQQQAQAGCRGNRAALSAQLSPACAAIPHSY